MNTTRTKRSFGRRFLDFVDSFDHASSDYPFEQAKHTAAKISDLEQRIMKLEQSQTVLREVQHREAV